MCYDANVPITACRGVHCWQYRVEMDGSRIYTGWECAHCKRVRRGVLNIVPIETALRFKRESSNNHYRLCPRWRNLRKERRKLSDIEIKASRSEPLDIHKIRNGAGEVAEWLLRYYEEKVFQDPPSGNSFQEGYESGFFWAADMLLQIGQGASPYDFYVGEYA